jgi:hypothetical protein
MVASGDEMFACRNGVPRSRSRASVGMSTATGRAITASERRTRTLLDRNH